MAGKEAYSKHTNYKFCNKVYCFTARGFDSLGWLTPFTATPWLGAKWLASCPPLLALALSLVLNCKGVTQSQPIIGNLFTKLLIKP